MNGPRRFAVGDRVGEWTLLAYQPGQKNPLVQHRWKCQCSCGVIRWVCGRNLTSGNSTSCGHGQLTAPRWRARNLRAVASVFELGSAP